MASSTLRWQIPSQSEIELAPDDNATLIARSSRLHSIRAACLLPPMGISEWELQVLDIGTGVKGMGIAFVEAGMTLQAGDASDGNTIAVRLAGTPPDGENVPVTCSGSVSPGDVLAFRLDMDTGTFTITAPSIGQVLITDEKVNRAQRTGIGTIRGHLWQPWCQFKGGRHGSITLRLLGFTATQLCEAALTENLEEIRRFVPGHGGQPGPNIGDVQCVLPCQKNEGALYISAGWVANEDTFLKLAIGGIVRLGNYTYDVADNIQVLSVDVGDKNGEQIAPHFASIISFVEEMRFRQRRNVLVHCGGGVSRSGSAVIAYVMWKTERSFDEALAFVKGCREWVSPNEGFAKQLKEFDFRSVSVT